MLRVEEMGCGDHTHRVMEDLIAFRPFRVKAQPSYARHSESV